MTPTIIDINLVLNNMTPTITGINLVLNNMTPTITGINLVNILYCMYCLLK